MPFLFAVISRIHYGVINYSFDHAMLLSLLQLLFAITAIQRRLFNVLHSSLCKLQAGLCFENLCTGKLTIENDTSKKTF